MRAEPVNQATQTLQSLATVEDLAALRQSLEMRLAETKVEIFKWLVGFALAIQLVAIAGAVAFSLWVAAH